ncbi:hypothetical protein I203_102899 [Kwoniella mangroviensis CBS 8507]|uniref:uncharacterized protein n=1 Tax=Kwoniella mangroviensis CBS 8507 TaxID=1296122 RepID=UPI00080D78B8|nr:uncharacterized protein I203_03873 [Kwoniella mangroviensis CBS 8507]OCF67186.1 hypothetical protein I203_03873 [Kwoniella mangroviensis CBS 8507]
MSIQKEYKFTRSTLPLPNDLLHILLQKLLSTSSFSTLSTLARLSKDYYSLIIPLIYKHVHITSDEQLQSFLTIPLTKREENDKKKRKIVNTVLLKGKSRSRSNSLEDSSNWSRKIQCLSLCESLTLDVYPSRTSFKIASKLPQPLQTPLLTFTPKSLENLREKLSRSGAPRILVSFWSQHLPTLIRPRKVVVDYSNLNFNPISNAGEEEEEDEEKWADTMSGMSISLQSWTCSEGLEMVELKGDKWMGVLPSPGVGVKMVHTTASTPSSFSAETLNGDEEEEELVTVNETVLNAPPNPNEPNPATLESIESRNKLVSTRVQSILMGLRTSQALYETYNSRLPLKWDVVDVLPPPIGFEEMDQEERYNEYQREKRKVLDEILSGLDEVAPVITRRYGRIGREGRRELSCLNWVDGS